MAHHPRSSSIPRHYRRIPARERFSVADAAQLKLKLQALDDKLDPDVDIQTLKSACQARPFHEEIYVDGSEAFFLLVKSIARADLIPDIYVEAYETLQQGRFPLNQFRVSDFTRGVDPTFSEIRNLLSDIDELCGTKLDDSVRTLEDRVKPFPFLQLPAELRLNVYSHILPREAHIAVFRQPQPGRDHKPPPHIRIDIMCTSHQLHAEVTKYFYENRTLCILAAHDRGSELLSKEYMLGYYETLAVMRPQTRSLFTRLDILITPLVTPLLLEISQERARRNQHVPSVADPMRHILALLPNLTAIVISLAYVSPRPRRARGDVAEQRIDTLKWLLERLPREIQVLWNPPTPPADDAADDVKTCWRIMKERGSLMHDVKCYKTWLFSGAIVTSITGDVDGPG